MTRRLILGIAIAGALAALGGYAYSQVRAAAASASAAQLHEHGEPAASEPSRGPVELDTRRQQLIGVRTVTVQRGELSADVRAAGTVAVDETRQSEISTRVDGWIRDLTADYTGRIIRRGEPLFTLYSPDLVATQQEYLLALRALATSAQDDERMRAYAERLVAAARERLLRLDMAPEDVDQLERTGQVAETITFRSPVTGTVVEKAAVRGMRVMAGQALYRVADLSNVWVEAEVYETDLAAVRPGVRVTVTFDAYPQRTFDGRISFVSPSITPDTRTARVRIALPNQGGLLKPNMLAEVAVHAERGMALVVPPDAIVNTGLDKLAFVAEGDGRFTPREVRVGRQTPDAVEILAGLQRGDTVAASATFFLDSESQLRGALQNYAPTAATAAAGPADATEVTFTTDPVTPSAGDVTLLATVRTAGAPIADAAVAVDLLMPAMPSMNMPAMHSSATLSPLGNGAYRGTGQVLMAGRWDVTVSVTKGGRRITSRQFALQVR